MKAIINIENYESFWVDYLDGKLTETDEERLFAFLEANPKISANLIDADDFMLPAPEVKFPGKVNLKADHQIDNLLISKIENEISNEDDNYITAEINSDSKIATSYSQYQKTILLADTSIVFEGKKYLKKTIVIPFYRYAAAIAAVFALVFVSGYFLTRNKIEINPEQKVQVAKVEIPVIENDTTKEIKIIDNNSPEKVIRYAQQSTTKIDEFIIVNEQRFKVKTPEKLPSLSVAAVENPERETSLANYIFTEPEKIIDNSFSYSMQYIKTPKENPLKSTINKIYKFGKGFDIRKSYDKVKLAKEEFLSFN